MSPDHPPGCTQKDVDDAVPEDEYYISSECRSGLCRQCATHSYGVGLCDCECHNGPDPREDY